MSTLQLVWDETRCYDLWSWESEKIHQTASVIRHLHRNIYLAHIGPVAEESTETVVIKLARGEKEQENLEREFDFYMHDLCHLQGQVVPQCGGIYRGRVNSMPLGCLVLQYCSGPPILDGPEFIRQVFIATSRLHEAGVVHGDLLRSRNIIQMGVAPRIIDFSTAIRHHCQNGIPTHPYPTLADGIHCCQELVDLVKTYGLNDMTKLRLALPMDVTSQFWNVIYLFAIGCCHNNRVSHFGFKIVIPVNFWSWNGSTAVYILQAFHVAAEKPEFNAQLVLITTKVKTTFSFRGFQAEDIAYE